MRENEAETLAEYIYSKCKINSTFKYRQTVGTKRKIDGELSSMVCTSIPVATDGELKSYRPLDPTPLLSICGERDVHTSRCNLHFSMLLLRS